MPPAPGRALRRAGADAARPARPAQISVHRPPASTSSRSPCACRSATRPSRSDQPAGAVSTARPRAHAGGRPPEPIAGPGRPLGSGRAAAQLLAQLLDHLAGAFRVRVQDQRRLEAAQRRLRLLQRVVDQAQAEQGAEMAGLERQGLLDVPDRGAASCPSGNAPSPACSSLRRTPAPARPCGRTSCRAAA